MTRGEAILRSAAEFIAGLQIGEIMAAVAFCIVISSIMYLIHISTNVSHKVISAIALGMSAIFGVLLLVSGAVTAYWLTLPAIAI